MTPREMALAKVEPAEVVVAPAAPMTIIRPVARPSDLIEYHKEVAALVTQALEKGRDYGEIPGTGNKPALFKAGAERLNLSFGAYPSYEIVASEVEHDRRVEWEKRKKQWKNRHRGDREFDWIVDRGESLGLYRYVIRCILRRRGTDEIVGEGIGTASTLESKYIDRPRDCENTIAKMAQKRALVAATLNAYGLSDRFTQDVEDFGGHDEPIAAAPAPDDAPTADPLSPNAPPKIGKDRKGRAFLVNWRAYVADGVLTRITTGRACGQVIATLDPPVLEAVVRSMPDIVKDADEITKPAHEACFIAASLELDRRNNATVKPEVSE